MPAIRRLRTLPAPLGTTQTNGLGAPNKSCGGCSSRRSLSAPRARRLPVARRARCDRARRRETRSPPADDGRARRVSARGVPLRPCTYRTLRCTYRTLRWCTVGGWRGLAPCSQFPGEANVEIGLYLGSVALMHDRGSDQSCPNVLPTLLTSDICRCWCSTGCAVQKT